VKAQYYAVLLDDGVKLESPDILFRRIVDNGLHLEYLDRQKGEWVEDADLYSYFYGDSGAKRISSDVIQHIVENWGLSEEILMEYQPA
jgi:hypothetical protein